MKLLTYKTLFLLTVATISRVSSISKLGPTLSVHQVSLYDWLINWLINETLTQDHVILNLIGLEKTSRPGNVRGYLYIQKFSDESSLCPMEALIEYFKRVSS